MAKFTKKVEIFAFQYDPEAMAKVSEYEREEFVAAALGDVSVNCITLKDGKLYASIYTFSEEGSKETFVLEPYEWLVSDWKFKVMSVEEFKKFATPA